MVVAISIINGVNTGITFTCTSTEVEDQIVIKDNEFRNMRKGKSDTYPKYWKW